MDNNTTAIIRKLNGANMDIDLATPPGAIAWRQDACPWNALEHTTEHRCAVKNVSICPYFCGVAYLDTLLCCYPHPNPGAASDPAAEVNPGLSPRSQSPA